MARPDDRSAARPTRGTPDARRRVALTALAVALGCAACPDERPPDYFVAPPVTRAVPLDVVEPADAAPVASTDAASTAPSDAAGPADAAGANAADPNAQLGLPDRVPSFVSLFRRLSPSVVNIYTQEVMQRRIFDALYPMIEENGTSLGSGIVLDAAGLILTNAHVVENAAEIRVRFHDDDELPARLVGLDPVRDLAVLKVDGATDLRPVVPGDSDAVSVGDWVVAIGNPLGLSHTMTKGIVSGKGRAEFINDRVGYLDLIQTDAAIHQGSSGGPLFDVRGRIIGVNTAINAEGRGIAFAIPWKAVEEAVPRLMQGGQVSRSWLGVYIVPRGQEAGGGILVDAVVDDSPAARAGLVPGDAIVGIDGRPVKDVAEFRLRIASSVAGRDILIDVDRGGEALQVSARLEEARDIR